MSFLKKYWVGIAVAVLAVLCVTGWVYIWNRIGNSMHDAEYAASFSEFSWHGADYARVSQEELQDHFSEPRTPESIAGDRLDEIVFPTTRGTETCTLYAAGYPDGVDGVYPLTVLHTGAGWFAYEVAGLESLGNSPSVSAVCGAFGLTDAGMIESVTIEDAADGSKADLTEPADLEKFYAKLTALGDSISEEEQAKAYYDAYVREYGEESGVTLEGGKVQFASEEANERATALWAEGVRLVTIRLRNGFRLRDLVYAPVPQLFTVYGCYHFDGEIVE